MLAESDFTRLLDAVARVEDPEVPVTLKDLGVLRSVTQSDGGVHVVLRATKIGCPGKSRMTSDIEEACRAITPGVRVDISWDQSAWTPDQVTSTGMDVLRDFGIVLHEHERVKCPYCSSRSIEMLSEYGGSICKVPYRCAGCGSMFERLRSIDAVQPVSIKKKAR